MQFFIIHLFYGKNRVENHKNKPNVTVKNPKTRALTHLFFAFVFLSLSLSSSPHNIFFMLRVTFFKGTKLPSSATSLTQQHQRKT